MKPSKQIINELRRYVASNRHINWYSSPENLSLNSIVEGTLNYGNFDDVRHLFEVLGEKQVKQVYIDSSKKTRNNLIPQVKNYFDLYFGLK